MVHTQKAQRGNISQLLNEWLANRLVVTLSQRAFLLKLLQYKLSHMSILSKKRRWKPVESQGRSQSNKRLVEAMKLTQLAVIRATFTVQIARE